MSTNKGLRQHPQQTFAEWYRDTVPGQTLKRLEFRYLLSVLKLTYNQTTLQVEHPSHTPECTRFPYSTYCLLTHERSHPHQSIAAPLIALPEEIPFADQSIDIICILHVMEFSKEPYRVLKECERILKPQGELHVLALNPWNPKNLPRCLPMLLESNNGNFIGASRLVAWLRALNLETELAAGFGLTPECCLLNKGSLLARSRAHLATAYAVRAKKRRQRLIPATPIWATIPEFIAGDGSIETAFSGLKR